MKPSTNRAVHALLTQLCLMEQKATLVEQVTNGRTVSSADMTDHEANKLLHWLRNEEDRLLKPMRGKVLHLLGLHGYTDRFGKLDFERINAFIQGIGSNNPDRKPLFGLTKAELVKVVTQVEQMYTKELKGKKVAA